MAYDLAPSLKAFRSEANARYPNRDKTSDGWIGDTSHQARPSDHNPGARDLVHAYDLDEDLDGNQTDSGAELAFLAEHMRGRRDPRIKYVIYEARIFAGALGPSPWLWRPYDGVNAHRKHLHVSILSTPEAEQDTRPWFPQEDDDMTPEQAVKFDQMHAALVGASSALKQVLDFGRAAGPAIVRIEQAVGDEDVDETEVARLVLAGLDPAAIAAAIPATIADQVADELAERLNG